MRLLTLLVCFLAGTSGVPLSQNADLMESLPVGDMSVQGSPVMQSSPSGSEVLVQAQHVPQHFQPESPRMPSGPQLQLPTLTNPWASHPNPNIGVSSPFQYLSYQHPQQPQVFYYPILGPQSRSPTFSYGVPVFQHTAYQQYPANAAPASQPLRAQQQHKQHEQNSHQMRSNQPQQQRQVQPFLYMVPQIQQRMAGPYGGLSSEELQNMGRMGRVDMHMRAIRGNMFPMSGPMSGSVVPFSSLRPVNTFHPNLFPATGMTYSPTAEVQPPSVVAVPPNRDAVPATGGSHANSGALPKKIGSVHDRDRVPCDHVLSAEIPLTNSGSLASGHGAFISAAMPTVQPDPHYSDPNLLPTIFPTPERKDTLVPASPPLLSDTVDTNTDMYP